MKITNMQMGLKVFAEEKPHDVAIVYYDQSLTFQNVYHRVNAIANSLLSLGVKKGDHIAVYMRNRMEMPETLYAIAAVGAVCLPINYMIDGENLLNLLSFSDVQYIFVEKEQLPNIEAIKEQLTFIRNEAIITVGSNSNEEYTNYNTMLQLGSIEDPNIQMSPEDTFNIMYSSGTTSLPKGIVFNEGKVFERMGNATKEWQINSSSITLISVPIYHSVGHTFTWFLPLFGCRIVIMREFNPITSLQMMQEHQVTHAFFVPTQYNFLLQASEVKEYQLLSLQLLISAAAPLSANMKKQIIKQFNCNLTEFFGSSETGAFLYLRPEDVVNKTASLGKKSEIVEVRLVDNNGNDVGVGEDGEFVIRSPFLFNEYYKLPHETKNAYLPGGWFCTGDMGKIDSEGFYYLLDRKKDMLISGGVNVYPKDIEEVIQLHPAVLEVAVIGIPSKRWGESVKAFVVLKEDKEITEDELIHFCNEKLAKFQRIKELEFINSLPRNPSGKILKRELRKKKQDETSIKQ